MDMNTVYTIILSCALSSPAGQVVLTEKKKAEYSHRNEVVYLADENVKKKKKKKGKKLSEKGKKKKKGFFSKVFGSK